MHRTKEQWLALFAEQAQSGLTQTEFAKRQWIIPTYFSYRKRQLLAFQDDDSGFVTLTVMGLTKDARCIVTEIGRLIVDNHIIHKSKKTQNWLCDNPNV